MKILAIRGCNLASLAGEFELDLAHGPLGGAGVFAIVGPTGAGKSTLLDAMCVALFDRTPRLTNRSTVVVGRGDEDPSAIGAQDVRTILRRGAAAGWAEVDFESGDARRYRARWSVRRARGATDGRFQSQQVTLTALDGGEPLGGTRTETLEEIHRRLGLTFDQFRRSALLAQGEFAAFLRADGKDRSELLERMTGTEIYTQLSMRAHVRAALAEQTLREQHGAAMAIGVLAADARAAAEAELELAREARGAARARLAEAEQAARWRAEADRRSADLAAAEAELAAAHAAIGAADGTRAELAARRRAEALRPKWDDRRRLGDAHDAASGEAASAVQVEARARAAHAEIAEQRARVAAAHAPLRDARIAAGLPERAERAERAEHDERDERHEHDEREAHEARRGDAAALLARAAAAAGDAAWLVARRGLTGEVGKWPELDRLFALHGGLRDELAAADRDHAAAVRRQAELDARRAVLLTEQRAAAQRLDETRRDAAGFHQPRALTLDAAGRQEKEARKLVGEVERLGVIARDAARAAAAAREQATAREALAAAAGHDREAVRAHTQARDEAAAMRCEREQAAAELRRAAGYQHARAELVDGEPCPLCGGDEHPWAGRGAFDALVREAEARLGELAAKIDGAVRELATLAGRADHRARELARLDADAADAEFACDAAREAWRSQLAALGELGFVAEPEGDAARELASERLAAARAKLEAAGAARSQAEAFAKAAQEAQARVQARQTELEHHAGKLADLDAARAELRAASERALGQRAARVERIAELGGSIAAAVERWSAALPAGAAVDPRDARGSIGDLARGWQQRAAVVAELAAQLAAAIGERDRQALAAELAATESAARRASAEQRRDALAAEAAAAGAALRDARGAAGFSDEELARLLAPDAPALDALAEQLAELDRALDRARTRAGERRRLVDDHAAARPSLDASAEPIDLEVLAAAVAAADHRAASLAAMLAADDDAHVRRAAALAQHAAAEQAVEVDRVLGEVIGSHDGKLFRSFAQSLTLDALLDVANSHLEELAPRYQLERVPKHDLELQVIDRDLGGEIRSVQTLSGGESFLVSLALALGLSSMSAHDVRVRTLMIDEGFGTLDPATLDSALAVLDALQATGRQVGVISHVPALLERVGAHVRVAPRGGGRSEVIVADA